MNTFELVVAILGGVAVAALLCWVAVTVALHLSRRAHGGPPADRHTRSRRVS